MSMHESLAAAALAGVLALSFPLSARGLDITSVRTPKSSIALPSASFAHAGTASGESTRSHGLSLIEKSDGTIAVRRSDGLQEPNPDANRDEEATWKGTVEGPDGIPQEVEILLRGIDVTGLPACETASLVQPGSTGNEVQIGFICDGAPTARARYEVSIRLSSSQRDSEADGSLPLSLVCPSSGKLAPKNGAPAPATPASNAPESASGQAPAPLFAEVPETIEVSRTWTDLIWNGYGAARLSTTQNAPAANIGADGADRAENADAEAGAVASGSEKPGAALGPDAADGARNDERGSEGAGAGEPASAPVLVAETGSDLAGALGAANDIDTENFTATVALDSPALLTAAEPVARAAAEPTRQYVILTCPKTFTFTLLPSGEIVAPSAFTILGGQHAYNDIKNMSLVDQSTQATLELYATEADGSLTKEFDGTTYLKGYRRMKVNEDVSYTAKLKGFDYAREQDLVMAAIAEPQHLFTLNVTFVPVIPSS